MLHVAPCISYGAPKNSKNIHKIAPKTSEITNEIINELLKYSRGLKLLGLAIMASTVKFRNGVSPKSMSMKIRLYFPNSSGEQSCVSIMVMRKLVPLKTI